MKALSSGSRRAAGFTLVEVTVVTAVMAMLLTALCAVYFASAADWQRQQGASDALTATSQACSRVTDYISQAVGLQVLTRYTTGDAIAVNLPADTANGGIYVPIWSGGKLQYRSGTWIMFYLSDSTGNYSRSGNILWAGSVTWPAGSPVVVADRSWSIYYDTQLGRIAPLSSIQFSLDSSGQLPAVTITATSTYKIATTNKSIAQSRTVCPRDYAGSGVILQ